MIEISIKRRINGKDVAIHGNISINVSESDFQTAGNESYGVRTHRWIEDMTFEEKITLINDLENALLTSVYNNF